VRTLSKLCPAVALDPRARVENSLRASAFGPGDLLPRGSLPMLMPAHANGVMSMKIN